MCLTIIALHAHPKYQLVIAANRDEFHNRPALAAHYWEDAPHILGGRDLQAGGTWLGVNQDGGFANLTNYRDFRLPQKPDAPSRGKIVQDLLHPDTDHSEFLSRMPHEADKFAGFNILFGTPENAWYYSNISNQSSRLQAGVTGLSNHLLNTPWPKLVTSRQAVCNWTKTGGARLGDLFAVMADQNRHPDELLPDTGIGMEFERKASAIFILDPVYGTRATTVIGIDLEGKVTYLERTFDPDGRIRSENEFGFQIRRNNES